MDSEDTVPLSANQRANNGYKISASAAPGRGDFGVKRIGMTVGNPRKLP